MSDKKQNLYLNPVVEVWIRNDIIKDPIEVNTTLDLDLMADQFSVTLDNTDGTTMLKYKKYDQIQIWAGYDKPDTIIFTGVVEKIKPQASNDGDVVTLSGKNMAFLLMQRNCAAPYDYSGRDVKDMVVQMLRNNFSGERFGEEDVINLLTKKLRSIPIQMNLRLTKSDTIAKALTKIKERVAYEVWMEPEGYLRIEPLSILMEDKMPTVTLTYGENLIEAEIEDLGNRINTVEVYGYHPEDYAAVQDIIARQEAGGEVRSEVIRDRSLVGYDACLKRAVEELKQKSKSFKVNATTIFLPGIKQGGMVYIDCFKIGVQGLFVVERVEHKISASEVSTKLYCFGGIIDRLPQKFVDNKMARVVVLTK